MSEESKCWMTETAAADLYAGVEPGPGLFWFDDGDLSSVPDRVRRQIDVAHRIMGDLHWRKKSEAIPGWYSDGKVFMPDFAAWCLQNSHIPDPNLSDKLRRMGCALPEAFDLQAERLLLKMFLKNLDPADPSFLANRKRAKADLVDCEARLVSLETGTVADALQETLALPEGQPQEGGSITTDTPKRGRGRPPDKNIATRNEKWINAARVLHKNKPTMTTKQIAKAIHSDIKEKTQCDGTKIEPLNPTAKASSTIFEVISPHIRKNT